MFHIACLTIEKMALLILILFTVIYVRMDFKFQLENSAFTAAVTYWKNSKPIRPIWDKNFEILSSAIDSTVFDTQVHLDLSHPLENLCKFPVLETEDPNIADYVQHVRYLTCKPVLPEFVRLFEGVLYVNQPEAFKMYNKSLNCWYRPFAGSLRPKITTVEHYAEWKFFTEKSDKIFDDQFEVKCTVVNTVSIIYRNAFAQIPPIFEENVEKKFLENNENVLSVDILGLDSTSLNMFKRHMPKSWDYFVDLMGGVVLEGYNKVADNSMVNWLPTLAGLRYGNQSATMASDFPLDGPLDLENVPFIWNGFKKKGCVTMFNDDPMHYTRGLFHYPWEAAVGFRSKPTDYYFRPWHVYHRQWPTNDSTYLCLNNEPYFKAQLNLAEQMIKRYHKSCHFSFSFFTDITHDDPNNLELMDETILSFLQRNFNAGNLNHTVLVLMGDHGHRIGSIQYTYVGRIEERAPFFGVYFPPWFRKKHEKIIENLKRNVRRLTSNYDVYQMFFDILREKFDGEISDVGYFRGKSLFEPISANRTCAEANIPENHCLCMEKVDKDSKSNLNILNKSKEVIRELTVDRLKLFPKCIDVLNVTILNSTFLTISQMAQHGVRHQIPEYLDLLKTQITGRIEYVELEYQLLPTDITALIRLQYDKWFSTLRVNVEPLPSNRTVELCKQWIDLAHFCACIAMKQNN